MKFLSIAIWGAIAFAPSIGQSDLLTFQSCFSDEAVISELKGLPPILIKDVQAACKDVSMGGSCDQQDTSSVMACKSQIARVKALGVGVLAEKQNNASEKFSPAQDPGDGSGAEGCLASLVALDNCTTGDIPGIGPGSGEGCACQFGDGSGSIGGGDCVPQSSSGCSVTTAALTRSFDFSTGVAAVGMFLFPIVLLIKLRSASVFNVKGSQVKKRVTFLGVLFLLGGASSGCALSGPEGIESDIDNAKQMLSDGNYKDAVAAFNEIYRKGHQCDGAYGKMLGDVGLAAEAAENVAAQFATKQFSTDEQVNQFSNNWSSFWNQLDVVAIDANQVVESNCFAEGQGVFNLESYRIEVQPLGELEISGGFSMLEASAIGFGVHVALGVESVYRSILTNAPLDSRFALHIDGASFHAEKGTADFLAASGDAQRMISRVGLGHDGRIGAGDRVALPDVDRLVFSGRDYSYLFKSIPGRPELLLGDNLPSLSSELFLDTIQKVSFAIRNREKINISTIAKDWLNSAEMFQGNLPDAVWARLLNHATQNSIVIDFSILESAGTAFDYLPYQNDSAELIVPNSSLSGFLLINGEPASSADIQAMLGELYIDRLPRSLSQDQFATSMMTVPIYVR